MEAGADLCELLNIDTEDQRAAFAFGIEEIFEDIMDEGVLVSQLPSRFEQPDGRVLHLDARVIRDESAAVAAVLMTVSDITELEAAQRENQQNQVLVSLLQQKEAFSIFLEDTRAQLEVAQKAIQSDDEVLVRRVVHTIKGNTSIYGIHDIVRFIHDIEEEKVISEQELDRIHEAFRAFLCSNQEVLSLDYDDLSGAGVHISQGHLDALRLLLERAEHERGQQLPSWAVEVIQQPAAKVLGPLDSFVERVAERLSKEVSFSLTGADTLVDAEAVRPVFQSLTHLLRNALDHGIEEAWEREGKPAKASLTVAILSDGPRWRIVIEDDGRGISTDRLVEKAVSAGLFSADEAAALSHEEKLQLIFHDGLSSSDAATDLSGRGVGMSAAPERGRVDRRCHRDLEQAGGRHPLHADGSQADHPHSAGSCLTRRAGRRPVCSQMISCSSHKNQHSETRGSVMMSSILAAPLLLAVSSSAQAADSPPELSAYGIIRPAYTLANGTLGSYGRANSVAPTMVAVPSLLSGAEELRGGWGLSQTRFGARVKTGPASGKVEIDFVDFGQATGTTTLRPRLRIAAGELGGGVDAGDPGTDLGRLLAAQPPAPQPGQRPLHGGQPGLHAQPAHRRPGARRRQADRRAGPDQQQLRRHRRPHRAVPDALQHPAAVAAGGREEQRRRRGLLRAGTRQRRGSPADVGRSTAPSTTSPPSGPASSGRRTSDRTWRTLGC